MSHSILNDQFILVVEEKISNDELIKSGLKPAFNVNDVLNSQKTYKIIYNSEVQTDIQFASMGYRNYCFYKSINNNIYIVEIYMGKSIRVFEVNYLFNNIKVI